MQNINALRYWGTVLAALAVWLAAYMSIIPLSQWFTYDALSLVKASPLANAVEFFVYDTAKILLLLVLMVYITAWLRATLNVERVRDYLAGKGRALGYVAGSAFGAISPFCSCSSIPLFLGFTTARIPFGITMSFLITSPLINEVAVVLLWGLLGWKFTVIYVTVGMTAGILGGIIMDALRAERWLQPFLLDAVRHTPLQAPSARCACDAVPQIGSGIRLMELQAPSMLNASSMRCACDVVTPKAEHSVGLMERHAFAWKEMTGIVHKVWLWVIIGVALGAVLHGYVPQEWFAQHLGAGQWWSVPLAVVLGIPLYTSCVGMLPVMESLLLKGLPVGTLLAFCMSSIAVSLPELLILKQVMRWQLLALFLGILLIIFTLVGWFFNATQGYIF